MSSIPANADSNCPPPPWALLADDLTGACDAAAPFAEFGFPVKVLLSREPLEIDRAGLSVVSTESRDVAPQIAAERVAAACEWFDSQGVRIVYKKIDSVLRGNVIEEVASALNSLAIAGAVLTPAFPKMGRIVSGGILTVPSQSGFTPIDLHERLARVRSIQVADAANDDDLAAIVHEAFESEPQPLLAGSAGLATALARYLAARFPTESNARHLPRCDSVLYVIGTPHAVTASQLDYLITERETELREFERLPLDAIALAGKRLVVRLGSEFPSTAQCAPLWDWMDRHPRAGIVLSGGDTAAFFCEASGARAIELGGEAFSGIPWGQLHGGRADGHFVVTKSGGFGGGATLVEVDDFLHESIPRS